MQMFKDKRHISPKTRRLYAIFELLHTLADFVAAFSFLVGSILFLWSDTETAAIWLFIFGSVFFCLKPTLKLIREMKLLSIGDTEDLAERFEP
ncbi:MULTISPECIES: YrhK family protein [unclassified Roseovarius]|uniref:YrhK family protein n=1 Tax=unclassified Roseovarius TaxID=2614913 RepID=UPI00273FB209|nr:YrhK family protein [Roseovarius sp. MMSF_3350]